jgi:hypothetical protein
LFADSGGATGRNRGTGAEEGLGVKRGKPTDGGRTEFNTGMGESAPAGCTSGGLCDVGESGRILAGGELASLFVFSDDANAGSFWSGSIMRTNIALSPNQSTLPVTPGVRL